jgi:rod shape-determining protein MreC
MLKRHQQVFIAIAVIAIGLMTLQSKFGPLRPFWFVSSALDRTNSAVTYLKDGLRAFGMAAVLNEEELMELRRRNMELRLELRDYGRLYRENARLRAALEFSDRTPGLVAVCRVVSKGGDPLSNYMVVDKGGRHGVRKDMVAIVPEGIIGKIMSVEPEYARVLLVDDPRFSAAVRVADSRAEGVYSGLGRGSGKLKYASVDVPIINGVSLVTSGLDALFPADITLGTISSVETLEDELFHKAEVKPVVDLQRIEEVIIITR